MQASDTSAQRRHFTANGRRRKRNVSMGASRYRQDFNENSSNEAAMTARPK
jgi:hypothetical protein